jgi:hypothetical protein
MTEHPDAHFIQTFCYPGWPQESVPSRALVDTACSMVCFPFSCSKSAKVPTGVVHVHTSSSRMEIYRTKTGRMGNTASNIKEVMEQLWSPPPLVDPITSLLLERANAGVFAAAPQPNDKVSLVFGMGYFTKHVNNYVAECERGGTFQVPSDITRTFRHQGILCRPDGPLSVTLFALGNYSTAVITSSGHRSMDTLMRSAPCEPAFRTSH